MTKFPALLFLFILSSFAEPLFDAYHDNSELDDFIENIQSPFLSKKIIGHSANGTKIHCLTLASGNETKPAILIFGDTNAASPVGTEILIHWLKATVKNEVKLKEILKDTSLYIIPRPFPESLNSFFSGPRFESKLNSTKVDSDSDLNTDEDGFEDLNKDGFISLMRIEDEDGEYYEHPESSYFMIKKENSKSKRYKVFSEGIDNDKDEQFNEDPVGGVNPNKNFSFQYPYFKKDAGVHQISENETKAIADFAFQHPGIYLVFSFGEEDNLTKVWQEDKNKKNQEIRTTVYHEDEKIFSEYAGIYKKAYGQDKRYSAKSLEKGSLAHWAYYHFGRVSLSAIPWEIPIKNMEGKKEDKIEQILWLEKNRPQALIKWQEIDHPDFKEKKVEIGGIKPFYSLVPEVNTCELEAEKFQAFIEDAVKLKPEVSIKEFSLEKLGKGLSRLTLKVKNTGKLPIRPVIGEKSGKMYPINVKLTLPEKWELYKGTLKSKIYHLNAGSSETLEWLILNSNSDGKVKVDMDCPQLMKVSAESEAKK